VSTLTARRVPPASTNPPNGIQATPGRTRSETEQTARTSPRSFQTRTASPLASFRARVLGMDLDEEISGAPPKRLQVAVAGVQEAVRVGGLDADDLRRRRRRSPPPADLVKPCLGLGVVGTAI
jgi:hypothetical protein